MDSEELEEAILQLPATQRARFAQLLIASLDEDEEIAAAWRQEAERRHEEIVSGRVATRPAAAVFAEARARLARRAAGG
jgi:putative addiction module component (TIGR02574 family)